jgi:hypothetical protein
LQEFPRFAEPARFTFFCFNSLEHGALTITFGGNDLWLFIVSREIAPPLPREQGYGSAAAWNSDLTTSHTFFSQ